LSRTVIQDCIDEEIYHDEINVMVDKIIEVDIWRDTVKEFQLEQLAKETLFDEMIDHLSKEFFFQNFNDIKNESLKNYKE
jgi:hypothetical protein